MLGMSRTLMGDLGNRHCLLEQILYMYPVLSRRVWHTLKSEINSKKIVILIIVNMSMYYKGLSAELNNLVYECRPDIFS